MTFVPILLAVASAASAALAGAAPVTLAAQDPAERPPRFEQAADFIRDAMAERNLPSVAVAVARDGEVLWEAAFGWADRERRIAATPHTLYSLASISKPMTATAVMRLAEEGDVSLERPANEYLGAGRITGLAGAADAATIRRVLAHTAGLPLHYRFFYEDDPHPVASPDEAIARYGIIVNPPGERYRYSNLGYGLLDQVVEHASDDDFAAYMRREVFAPLGLTRTSVHLTPALERYAATRYDGDLNRIPYYHFDHDGASALWSSAHDLIRFGLFHLGHVPDGARPVLADSTRALMQRKETPGDGGGYGLGWFVEPDEYGFRSVWHSGSMPGVSTMLRLYPDEDVAVVVLLNTLDRRMRLRIAEELVAAVLPDYGDAMRAVRDRQRARAEEEEAARAEDSGFRPPPELEGEWTGMLRTYSGEHPLTLVVQPDGDVHVRLDGQLTTLLDHRRWRDGRLTGRFAGTIPTEDARRHEHSVLLDVRLRDGVLRGRATAQTASSPVYFALSSYVELTRAVAVRAGQVERGLLPLIEVEGRARGPFTLDERMRHYRVPGVGIAVIDAGEIVWARGYGVAKVGADRPITPGTLFQAASISKPVAAMGALRLVEDGRLSLDEDVNRRLSSWTVPGNDLTATRPVTLRGLLTHTAGLTVHGFRGYARGEPVPGTVQVLDGEEPANSAPVRVDIEPGSAWRYSGGGYTVLQLLLTDVTGRSFHELLRNLVLDPIGMEESTYRQPLPPDRAGQAAAGHHSNGRPVEGDWHTYPEQAAAGLWTTPSDLARYIIAVQRAFAGAAATADGAGTPEGPNTPPARADALLDRETARALLRPHRGGWGLGPQLEGEGEALRFSHGGANAGFRAHFVGFAERGRGAVVMTNSDNGGTLAQEILRAIARVYGWPGFGPRRVVTPVDVEPEVYDEVAGTYALERNPDATLTVARTDDGVAASLTGGPASPLVPVAPDTFVSLDAGAEIRFARDEDDRIVGARFRGARLVRVERAVSDGAG